MSLALTNERRDSIIRAALKSTFTARKEALKVENNALAELAYSHLYPNDVQLKMAALPAEFFSQTSSIFAYLPGNGRDPVSLVLTSSRKISARDKDYRRPAYTMDKDNAITARVTKLKDDSNRLEADENSFKSELRRFLAGITTVKKLQAVWPEGEEFYKHLLDDASPKNALAIIPDTINAMIGTMKEVK
jgi:hypothetical protein